ncbi:MAG: hypothetical protein HC877_20645 [Thioploca sp.]|nr:hypothetical protein [Thioploca sp.]
MMDETFLDDDNYKVIIVNALTMEGKERLRTEYINKFINESPLPAGKAKEIACEALADLIITLKMLREEALSGPLGIEKYKAISGLSSNIRRQLEYLRMNTETPIDLDLNNSNELDDDEY